MTKLQTPVTSLMTWASMKDQALAFPAANHNSLDEYHPLVPEESRRNSGGKASFNSQTGLEGCCARLDRKREKVGQIIK